MECRDGPQHGSPRKLGQRVSEPVCAAFEDRSTKTRPMLSHNASGPEVGLPGRISAGFQSGRPQNRPSRRPKAVRRGEFEVFRIRIRPKSSPEARFPAPKHYRVTSSNTVGPKELAQCLIIGGLAANLGCSRPQEGAIYGCGSNSS